MGRSRDYVGGRRWYVHSCARHSGRHLPVRGMHPHQTTSRHRVATHSQVAPRAILRGSSELPQGWRRFPVGRSTRGRYCLRNEVSQPPGSSRRQGRKPCGKFHQSQTRELGPSANSVSGAGPFARTRACSARNGTARQVASAIATGSRRCCSDLSPASADRNSPSGHVPSSRKESYATQNDLSPFLAP